jgi:hypothetical protein
MPRRNKTNNQKGISVNPIKRGDKLGRAPLVADAALLGGALGALRRCEISLPPKDEREEYYTLWLIFANSLV